MLEIEIFKGYKQTHRKKKQLESGDEHCSDLLVKYYCKNISNNPKKGGHLSEVVKHGESQACRKPTIGISATPQSFCSTEGRAQLPDLSLSLSLISRSGFIPTPVPPFISLRLLRSLGPTEKNLRQIPH